MTWLAAPRGLDAGERDGGDSWCKGQANIASVDHVAAAGLLTEVVLKNADPVGHRRARRSGEFDLDGNQLAGGFHDQIHFGAGGSPPEIDLRFFSPVDQRLQNLNQNRGFKNRSAMGPAAACSGSFSPARWQSVPVSVK